MKTSGKERGIDRRRGTHTFFKHAQTKKSNRKTKRDESSKKEIERKRNREIERKISREEGTEIETGKDLDGSAANCRLPKQHRSINQRKILDERMNMTKLNDKKV